MHVPQILPPILRRAAAALALASLATAANAQTPVLRWAFDAGKGAPVATTWISGGVLRADAKRLGHAPFQSSGGVSLSTPGVFSGADNVYGDAGAPQLTSVDSPLVAEMDLAQFVVTMWVKPIASPSDQNYARFLIISPAEDEKAKTGSLYMALNMGNLEVGINGNGQIIELGTSQFKQGEWTFVVFAYDGLARNPYFSPDMNKMVKGERNTAILIGGLTTPVTLVGSPGINGGPPNYDLPAGTLSLNGCSVAVGSSTSNPLRAFCGLIDDIRIYGRLLTTTQIEAVRLSSLGDR